MSEETKNISAWVVAALVVGFVFFEEARFDRRLEARLSTESEQVDAMEIPEELAPTISASLTPEPETAMELAKTAR